MFKKNAHVVSTRALSGKDVKSLRTNIAQSFPQLSEAQVDDLVPAKAAVTLHKLANRIEAYGLADGGPPLFFEVHEQLLPTLYTLWHMPHMLPQLHTYSEVSPKVGFAGACVWPPCEVSRQVAKLLREQNSFRPVEITSFASRDLIVGLHKFT
mmetsp:Transcript_2667/g.7931  ORF Transcript_2667/g.7931 Transcript_2667/m.7931 type:complete len:153 (-) Transcript_2667:1974-2432(-)